MGIEMNDVEEMKKGGALRLSFVHGISLPFCITGYGIVLTLREIHSKRRLHFLQKTAIFGSRSGKDLENCYRFKKTPKCANV